MTGQGTDLRNAVGPPTSGVGKKNRPQNVTELLFDSGVHPTWDFANRNKHRFYIINLEHILGRLHLQHTKTQPYFDAAENEIATQTTWQRQHPFEYRSSRTQIFPDKIRSPKLFGIAATIIVAMEIAAREQCPDLNVYDSLRILPAQYFVDRFHQLRLSELRTFYSSLTEEERIKRFGVENADKSFNDVCLQNIEQSRVDVLQQMAQGYCVTAYTARKLVSFVNNNFPEMLHVGPVRSSGEEADTDGLGTKNAVAGLRVPRTVPPSELTEWIG
jgi:hypothetical protein